MPAVSRDIKSPHGEVIAKIKINKEEHTLKNNKKKPSQETIQQQLDTADMLTQQKTKESTYGINPSENCTLMIATDSPSDHKVEMNT